MTSKDFNLAYRGAVSRMLRIMRSIYLTEHNSRITDKDLAAVLQIQPNTFSRLYRGCFNASPVVLMRICDQIGFESFVKVLRESDVFFVLYGGRDGGCPRDCHGDCEFCVKA